MNFQGAEEKPKRLLEAKKISKSFTEDAALFENLNLLLTPGTRLGILGENGCGKSSLIRVLLKEEKPDRGDVFHSDLLEVAYFEQGKELIDPDLSLIRTVCPDGDHVYYRGRHVHVRSYLGRFLFENEKMDMPVGFLSGGEQSRLLIAKLMLIEANLLILDEPTNDLDIATLNVLEDCLKEFEGAVLLVTHDRFFLERVSTQLLAFPPKRLSSEALQFFESFDQWKHWYLDLQKKARFSAPQKKAEVTNKIKNTPRLQSQIMKKIENAEQALRELEEECSSPEVSSNFELLAKKGDQMTALQDKIVSLYQAWSEIE